MDRSVVFIFPVHFDWFRKGLAIKELRDQEMIEKAKTVFHPRELFLGNRVGDIACALLSTSGMLYLGACIDSIAVWGEHTVLPPCGRCREPWYEIDEVNLEDTIVILEENNAAHLKDLLLHPDHEG